MNQENAEARRLWRRVIDALEESIPLYEEVNNLISFRGAQTWREWAVRRFCRDGMSLIDVGVGPGAMSSAAMATAGLSALVGLDFSTKMLEEARGRLGGWPMLVRGIEEALPFRDGAFDGAMCGFSLRDSFDLESSLKEVSRVLREEGRFLILDIGKPENPFIRGAYSLYWRLLAPLIAGVRVRGALASNPWRWLYHTFRRWPTNRHLEGMLQAYFRGVDLEERLLGCVIACIAEK